MLSTHITRVALAATFALAACGEPEVVTVNRYDPMADELRNAAPVEPPPMIEASHTYRCRDNSLIYVDFYTNDTALVRTERGGDPVASLTAEGGNPPYEGQEGYSISANADEISYTAPGSGTQSCHS